jgi:hypothetical protein
MAAAKKKTLDDAFTAIEVLDERVTALETSPRRTGRPPLIKECALGFAEGECEKHSVYQYHQGCRGIACSQDMSAYTAKQKLRASGDVTAEQLPAKAPRKKPVAKKTAAPRKVPTKKAPPAPNGKNGNGKNGTGLKKRPVAV